jgi:hypothetical protein
MAKLFVFGIGGTGSRVIKAFTMLLASGVELDGIDKVVPIVIDPDTSNGDVMRTNQILQNYQKVRKKLEFDKEHSNFFKTNITALSDLGEGSKSSIADNFTFHLAEVANQQFGDYIGLNTLSKENKALIKLLFSTDNLEADMKVGFKGNPNIGSVVLNQLKGSDEFKQFASSYAEGDKIFIISSIFGGTGASGFPLLVKNIRNPSESLPNTGFLKKSIIGAITVLPYFGVAPDPSSKIDKGTFVSKAKAALSYYSKNLTTVNALYYIGDDISKDYPNKEGSEEQKNTAHFIELASALAIVNFTKIDNLETSVEKVNDYDKVTVNNKYYKYGIKGGDTVNINYTDLDTQTTGIIQAPLTQYHLFQKYLREHLDQAIGKKDWSVRGTMKMDSNFVNDPQGDFFSPLLAFNDYFSEWLDEMSENERSFTPFNKTGKDNLFDLLNNIEKKKHGLLSKKNYALFDAKLNAYEKEVGDIDIEHKFMAIFSLATKELIKERFGLAAP